MTTAKEAGEEFANTITGVFVGIVALAVYHYILVTLLGFGTIGLAVSVFAAFGQGVKTILWLEEDPSDEHENDTTQATLDDA